MKKSIIFVSILFLFITSLFAQTKSSFSDTLRLSLTVVNKVYVGVSSNSVNSSIVPKSNIKELGFSYDPTRGEWRTDSVYIYAISFVSSPIKLSLVLPSGLEGDGKSIHWSINTLDMSFDSDEANKIYMLKEETEASYNVPRVYSKEFQIVIPGNTDFGTTKSFEATFTIKVEGK